MPEAEFVTDPAGMLEGSSPVVLFAQEDQELDPSFQERK
jgi:hypothetical protein